MTRTVTPSAQPPPECIVEIVREPRALPGTRYGQRQPVLLAVLRAACPPRLDLNELAQAAAGLLDLPPFPMPERGRDRALVMVVQRLAVALQRWSGHPVFDDGATIAGTGDRYMVVIPHDDQSAAHSALRQAMRAVLALADTDGEARAAVATSLGRFREAMRARASQASNTLHMLTAVDELGVPWSRVLGYTYQIGHGARARWFDSTITDATPRLGSALAQNKMTTAEMLWRAGLPAPRHSLAESADDAVAVAARLGYPVVVKPIDLDGGRGVAAGLGDEDALRGAFAATAAHGRPVLVEKHVDGGDFRLVVIGGRTAMVITRQPAGVTGDGEATVAELLSRTNADPRRGNDLHSPLKRIDWDDEAAAMVAEQGLAPDAVPAAGRFVRLRRAANIATGGMPVAATEHTHPDNLRLAERAAAVFGLDLAGIDFITPDIGRSWLKVGGIINEVNVQPNVGVITARHLFGEMVRWMLDGTDGRIPIAAVTGGDGATRAAVAATVHRALVEGGTRAGLARREGAWIGTERVSAADMRGHRGGALLLADRGVEAAVLDMPGAAVAALGLPFDACDVVAALPGIDDRAAEDDLVARARRRIVVAADDGRIAAGAVGARQVLLLDTDRDHPLLAAHRARGGETAWIAAPDAIALGRGDDPPTRLVGPANPATLAAAAAAHAIGCGAGAIERALQTAGALPAGSERDD